MADFDKAHALTSAYEGGYANNPADRGGETYRGIARKFHPNWGGWKAIDAAKGKIGARPLALNAALAKDAALGRLVNQFYENEFWDKVRGSDISSQRLANYVFDFAVNSGVTLAVRYLQRALNAHAHNRFVALATDGQMGAKSLAAMVAVGSDIEKVANTYLEARRAFFEGIAARDSSQERFLKGWLNRLGRLERESREEDAVA